MNTSPAFRFNGTCFALYHFKMLNDSSCSAFEVFAYHYEDGELKVHDKINKILVVDDAEVANTLEILLTSQNFKVITACHGCKAKDMITALFEKGGPVEIAINDIIMPDLNAFEFFEFIELINKSPKDLSIIVITRCLGPLTIKEDFEHQKDSSKLKPLSSQYFPPVFWVIPKNR